MKVFEIETYACTNCHYQQDFEPSVLLCPNCKAQDLEVSAQKIQIKVRDEADAEMPMQQDETGAERAITAQEVAKIKADRKRAIAAHRADLRMTEL